MKSGNKIVTFLLVFFILLGGAFGFYYYKTYKEEIPQKKLPIYGEVDHKIRSFAFTDQEGKTITEKDVAGKIYVVEYFFTTCKGICPKMNEQMDRVYKTFRGNKDVMILSHTVDPIKDTVAAMKEYSLRFEADPQQWKFLTGSKKELYDMARYSYLVTAADDTMVVDIESDFIHTDRFVLVDKNGHIRGQYEGTDPGKVNQLIGDMKGLLKDQQKL